LVWYIYCAWLVSIKRELIVGDYILYGTHILQLYTPLYWFGTYYRFIQQAFIDMENIPDLLGVKPDIEDSLFATDIVINNGMIEFDNVCFHYQPERPILKNVSCRILPGQTLANVESGLIKIDGTDIPTITQTHFVVNCTARYCFIQ